MAPRGSGGRFQFLLLLRALGVDHGIPPTYPQPSPAEPMPHGQHAASQLAPAQWLCISKKCPPPGVSGQGGLLVMGTGWPGLWLPGGGAAVQEEDELPERR